MESEQFGFEYYNILIPENNGLPLSSRPIMNGYINRHPINGALSPDPLSSTIFYYNFGAIIFITSYSDNE